MRAWLMDSYHGVEKLRLGEVPDPRPGPDDVLLELRYAALNPADAFLASGMYPAKPSRKPAAQQPFVRRTNPAAPE